jgi:putative transposase
MGKRLKKVALESEEQATLESLVKKGKHSVRKIKRAQILLHLHEGKQPVAITEAIGVSLATVYNVHGRYLQDKLAALEEKPRPGQPRKVTPEVEAAVTRIACSQAPQGYARWTVSLLNERIVQLGYQVHDESVRLVLKKVNSSPGLRSNGALVK